MSFHDGPALRQSDAEAVGLGGRERPEQPRPQELVGHAAAFVAHAQFEHRAVARAGLHAGHERDQQADQRGCRRRESAAAACLRLAENHHVQLFISRAIIKEVENVLSRDYIRARFKTLTDESVQAFIARLREAADLIRVVPRHFKYEHRDVKDEPYINLAIETQAHYLVSRDNDLLDLMKWEKEDGREFQKRFRFLQIVTPEKFLAAVEKSNE